MTGFLHEKEFSRKSFVKGGGALIIGFSVLGSALAGKASAAESPYASNPIDQFAIDAWITIHADNTAAIKTGGIKQGTGSDTGLLMIAGEELDMGMSQLEFVIADTGVTPDTGSHTGSNTILNSGRPSARPRRRRSRCCSGSRRRSWACRPRSSLSAMASSPVAASPSPTAS
jgi:isoquinoline 1-oxidoreductase beta subunit